MSNVCPIMSNICPMTSNVCKSALAFPQMQRSSCSSVHDTAFHLHLLVQVQGLHLLFSCEPHGMGSEELFWGQGRSRGFRVGEGGEGGLGAALWCFPALTTVSSGNNTHYHIAPLSGLLHVQKLQGRTKDALHAKDPTEQCLMLCRQCVRTHHRSSVDTSAAGLHASFRPHAAGWPQPSLLCRLTQHIDQ